MIRITLDNFAELLNCKYVGHKNIFFKRMILDSRKAEPGDLFLAVKGENADGHQYIKDAISKGAVGVVSFGGRGEIFSGEINCIFADNLERFLCQAARLIRKKTSARVIGITGSVGKTTTKDMLYSLLSFENKVIKTQGNLNNELGLPLTMSLADEETGYMILEMGMRGPDEIRYLCQMARPDYGIITNIEPVHAELLGSIENIARAKAEIAEEIPENGALIINFKDKDILEPFLKKCRAPIYTVGFDPDADYFIERILTASENISEYIIKNKQKRYKVQINAIGKHNIQDSAMVFALGRIIGVNDLAFDALKDISFSEMRFDIREVSGIKIINDAYNANPSSTSYSLDSLRNVEGKRKIFVFGDMFELGQYEKKGHEKIAEKIIENNIDYVFLVGERARFTYNKLIETGYENQRAFFFQNKEELLSTLKKCVSKGDVILLKASRGMHFETIAKDLEEYLNVL